MSLPFLDLRSLLTFQQPGLLAFAVKIELTLCQPQLKIENNTHAIFFLTNLSGFHTIAAGMQRLPVLQRSIVMKTLITALA